MGPFALFFVIDTLVNKGWDFIVKRGYLMNYTKIMAGLCIILLFSSQSILCNDLMQPIKKDGRYYYDESDTHEYMNWSKAVSYLRRKLLNPQKWVDKAHSYLYPRQQTEVLSSVEVLNPMQTIPAACSIEPKITWVGHATFLIQVNGFNILTDPIFGSVQMGPIVLDKRAMPVGIKLRDLPPIDAIVISHNHPDHTHTETLQALAQKHKPTVFVPEGNKPLIESMGFKNVVEHTWWEDNTLTKEGRSVTFTCLPAYHASIRFSFDSCRRALCSSWMIGAENKNIYFAGDTAYGKHFKQIATQFSSIDVALLPISPTSERENKHKYAHVDAPEAVDAFIDLQANCFVPMHYATFSSKPESLSIPLARLHESWQTKVVSLGNEKSLLMARCGQEYLI